MLNACLRVKLRFKNSLSDPNKNNLDLHNWFFSMEIVKNSLGSLFLKKMFVPDYQRGYSWSLDNVEDLFTDLSNYMKAKDDDEYLFGQIIIHEETIDGNTRLNIVDGQQRLATVTIFVLLELQVICVDFPAFDGCILAIKFALSLEL